MLGLALLVALTTPALIVAQTQAENGSSPYPTAPKWEPPPPPQPPPIYTPLSLPPVSFGPGSLKPFLRFRCEDVYQDGSREGMAEDVILRRGRLYFLYNSWIGREDWVFDYQWRGKLVLHYGHNENVAGDEEGGEFNVTNDTLQFMFHKGFPSWADCRCVQASEDAYLTVGVPGGFDWKDGFEVAVYHLLSMNLPPGEFFKHYPYHQTKQWIITNYSTMDGGKHLQKFLSILDEAYAEAKRGASGTGGGDVVRFKVPDVSSGTGREVTTTPGGKDASGGSELSPRLEQYFSGQGQGAAQGSSASGPKQKDTHTPTVNTRPDWLK